MPSQSRLRRASSPSGGAKCCVQHSAPLPLPLGEVAAQRADGEGTLRRHGHIHEWSEGRVGEEEFEVGHLITLSLRVLKNPQCVSPVHDIFGFVLNNFMNYDANFTSVLFENMLTYIHKVIIVRRMC